MFKDVGRDGYYMVHRSVLGYLHDSTRQLWSLDVLLSMMIEADHGLRSQWIVRCCRQIVLL